MEVGVSCPRPKAAFVGDVDEHNAVIRKATPDAAQTTGWIIQVLQDGCQQHDVVLLMSILPPSLRGGVRPCRSLAQADVLCVRAVLLLFVQGPGLTEFFGQSCEGRSSYLVNATRRDSPGGSGTGADRRGGTCDIERLPSPHPVMRCGRHHHADPVGGRTPIGNQDRVSALEPKKRSCPLLSLQPSRLGVRAPTIDVGALADCTAAFLKRRVDVWSSVT